MVWNTIGRKEMPTPQEETVIKVVSGNLYVEGQNGGVRLADPYDYFLALVNGDKLISVEDQDKRTTRQMKAVRTDELRNTINLYLTSVDDVENIKLTFPLE